MGQSKQEHPGCAEPPHQAAGHGNDRQGYGVAAQQASQYRGV